MFTNKHVIAALIVTPVLAVLGWYGVGQIAGEKPQLAKKGSSYPLVEKSNCRWESGQCDLQNEDFKITLKLLGNVLKVNANVPLERVLVALAEPGIKSEPNSMQGKAKAWQLDLGRLPQGSERFQIVASSAGSHYFGEASTTFTFGTGAIPGSE